MGFWGLGFRSVGLRDFGVGFRISLTMVGWGTSELGCQHSWTSCTFWRSGTRIAAFSSRAVKVPNGLALGRAFSWNWPSTRERNMVGTKKIKKKKGPTHFANFSSDYESFCAMHCISAGPMDTWKPKPERSSTQTYTSASPQTKSSSPKPVKPEAFNDEPLNPFIRNPKPQTSSP